MDNPVWSYIFGPPKEKKTLLELIRNIPVFESLSNNELVQIERMLHERRYMPGESVFNEGEPGAGMYIIQKGTVVIKKSVSDTDSIELAKIGEKNFFGELALLDEIPRSASACTEKESVLLGFSKPDLEKIMERNPRLGMKILGNVAFCRSFPSAPNQ
jgi:CRP-like cAMP-binding protein